ncbi:MAG: hypothetical protein QME49_08210 [bacterium]|nr:hypothetical protein [bacterium]
MQAMLTPQLKYEIVELIDRRIQEKRIQEKHVTKEDFTELKNIVKDLATAQKRTELKVEELAEAQKETQIEIKEAQKEIKILAQAMNYTRRDLGGITSTLGFMLENEAYRILPGIFKDRYGIEIKERFLRRSMKSLGISEEGEINIFSRGVYADKGKEVIIIGESKSQLGKDDIDDLLNMAVKLKGIDKKKERFLLAVTHYARETVIEYAKEKGVEVIQSFEW